MTPEEWLGANNTLGLDIWHKKYQDGPDETLDMWFDRVSGGNPDVRQLIVEKKFMPGGRILANRGLKQRNVTLSNCYVVTPPEDSIESIFDCAKKLARTYSYGGGCGTDISKLAPRGALINNAAKSTTGAVSFMSLLNMTTSLIGQNGRRGALMLSMAVDHPDLEEFINVKSDLSMINFANTSVRISDDFMKAVENNEMFTLKFTRPETGECIQRVVDAKNIYEMMCTMNWRVAEPGMLFWDRINTWSLLSEDPNFAFAGTNPCAEEPLPAGGSCLLGHMNLSAFVSDNGVFNTDGYAAAVRIAVRGLNEILDEGLPLHPLAEQRDTVSRWRQIGLGIFGLADMLIKMGIRYGSTESIKLCDRIGRVHINNALFESAMLAKELGQYQMYYADRVRQSEFYRHNVDSATDSAVYTYGLRNSQLCTIAPTGSVSSMLGINGGIEPLYDYGYDMKTESLNGKEQHYTIYTPIVKTYMEEHGLTSETELPDFFVTAKELDYKERITMQAVWQSHIDASISSTINVPNEFTVEEVKDLYKRAHAQGLKGVTIFRDGCERAAVLSSHNPEDNPVASDMLERGYILPIDDSCVGKKRTLQSGCGTLHCQAWFDRATGELREVFLSKGSSGGCNNFMNGLSRMVSVSARAGVNIYGIVDQLRSAGVCPSYATRKATKGDTSIGSSCPVAVSYALEEMYKEMQAERTGEAVAPTKRVKKPQVACEKCGAPMAQVEGCITCTACGWSPCN